MKIRIETKVAQHFEQVAAGFDEALFKALAPRLLPTKVLRFDGSRTGDEVHLTLGPGPLAQRWEALVVEHGQTETEIYFVDHGKKLPFPLKSWIHTHRIQKANGGGTVIVDAIDFQTLHPLLNYLFFPIFWWLFKIRQPVYRRTFSEGYIRGN